jgi:hypothetical protein
MSEKVYTLREAAAASGVSLHSIKVGCKNGSIEYIQYGEGEQRVHKRLSQSQVDALRESRTVKHRVEVPPRPVDDIDEVIRATRAARRRSGARRAA